jgi:hypothetical protein
MSTEHSREVLKDIAMETADEGNVPGRPVLGGVLIGLLAVFALVLVYVATATAPSKVDLTPPPKAFSDKSQ